MTSLRRLLVTSVTVVAIVASGIARGDAIPVIDVSNLAENIKTAAQTLQQVNNQITQIQQFVQMLQNQALNLTSLPFSVLSQLTMLMGQLNSLMGQAQALVYQVDRLEQQFQTLYPTYGANVTQAGLIADANARWAASVATYQHTMTVQSQIVSGIPSDQAMLTGLVSQSQGAVGALQAVQAGNQMLALQSRQLSATQDLMASSARAEAAEAMRHAEVENAAQAEWQRFYGNGVGYTPEPVQVFGGASP